MTERPLFSERGHPPPLRRDGKALRRYRPKLPDTEKQRLQPHEVRAIREALGMTQEIFALTFGIPLKSLHLWEYGKHGARGAAATLLRVIAHNPRAVVAALKTCPPALRLPTLGDVKETDSQP